MGSNFKRRIFSTFLFFMCVFMIGKIVYSDTDWPIYRGDQMLSGVAKGKLPNKLRLLWSFKTEDEIKSSPVVGNGIVFIGSFDGRVYALDIRNGKKIWDFNTENAIEASPVLIKSGFSSLT